MVVKGAGAGYGSLALVIQTAKIILIAAICCIVKWLDN